MRITAGPCRNIQKVRLTTVCLRSFSGTPQRSFKNTDPRPVSFGETTWAYIDTPVCTTRMRFCFCGMPSAVVAKAFGNAGRLSAWMRSSAGCSGTGASGSPSATRTSPKWRWSLCGLEAMIHGDLEPKGQKALLPKRRPVTLGSCGKGLGWCKPARHRAQRVLLEHVIENVLCQYRSYADGSRRLPRPLKYRAASPRLPHERDNTGEYLRRIPAKTQ